MQRDRDNLRQMIREQGFAEFEDDLLKYARPSIRVYTEQVADEDTIAIGQSKIGGCPDLPRNMDWVTVNVKEKQVSLHFIAQFDLKAIKPYDEENLLPEQGILYFFAGPWVAHKHSDKGRVLYYDGDSSLLERKEFPDDIPLNKPREWGVRYDPCIVTLVPEVNLPFEIEEWIEIDYPQGKTWEDFYDVLYSASYTRPRPPHIRDVNRLLGYNYDVPAAMQLDCQLIADTGSPYYASEEARNQAKQRKGDWQLLFQMDSDRNAGMMWSDSGVICFYIRHDDLRNRDFTQTCLAFFTA